MRPLDSAIRSVRVITQLRGLAEGDVLPRQLEHAAHVTRTGEDPELAPVLAGDRPQLQHVPQALEVEEGEVAHVDQDVVHPVDEQGPRGGALRRARDVELSVEYELEAASAPCDRHQGGSRRSYRAPTAGRITDHSTSGNTPRCRATADNSFTAGRGRLRIGEEERDVAPGDCAVIPPGAEHKLVNTGKDPLVLLCCCAPAYSHEDTILTESQGRSRHSSEAADAPEASRSFPPRRR